MGWEGTLSQKGKKQRKNVNEISCIDIHTNLIKIIIKLVIRLFKNRKCSVYCNTINTLMSVNIEKVVK